MKEHVVLSMLLIAALMAAQLYCMTAPKHPMLLPRFTASVKHNELLDICTS